MASMRPDITKVSISALVISLPIIYVSLLRVPPSTLARDSTFWFLMSNSMIAIIAAHSGMLSFSSTSQDDHPDVPGDQPAATVQEDYSYAMSVSLMAPHEPTAPVDISGVVVGGGEQLPTGGVVSCKAADTGGMEEGHEMALTQGEGAASKPKTDMVDHVSVVQRCDQEEVSVVLEPISANKNDAKTVKSDQWTIPQEAQITVTPDDVPRDRSHVEVAREEMKPRCSVTEASKPPEYWQLSDEELNRKVEEFIARFNRDMIEQEAAV